MNEAGVGGVEGKRESGEFQSMDMQGLKTRPWLPGLPNCPGLVQSHVLAASPPASYPVPVLDPLACLEPPLGSYP